MKAMSFLKGALAASSFIAAGLVGLGCVAGGVVLGASLVSGTAASVGAGVAGFIVGSSVGTFAAGLLSLPGRLYLRAKAFKFIRKQQPELFEAAPSSGPLGKLPLSPRFVAAKQKPAAAAAKTVPEKAPKLAR